MAKLIDSRGTIISQGSAHHCNEVHRVLTTNIYSVSEEDEVIYGDILYNTTWYGKLTIDYET